MSNSYVLISVAVSALVTAAIRFLPFIIFSGGKKVPSYITYLGKVLPYAIMGMLVVYCVKSTKIFEMGSLLPQLIAGLVVSLSYVWKRNTLISIVGGTVCYMLLVQLVF